MDHEIAIRYISALGFPICSAIAMGWALFRVGTVLLESHLTLVQALRLNNEAMVEAIKQQTVVFMGTMTEANKSLDLIATDMEITKEELLKHTKVLDKWPSDYTKICQGPR